MSYRHEHATLGYVSGSPREDPRAILSVTAVGVLPMLLMGGGAMAFSGIGPAAKLLRGPENQAVGESPPNPLGEARSRWALPPRGVGGRVGKAIAGALVPRL